MSITNKHIQLKTIIIFILLLGSQLLVGQKPGAKSQEGSVKTDSTKKKGKVDFSIKNDSIRLKSFTLNDLNELKPFSDTTLTGIEDWNILNDFDEFNLYLGSPASSHFDLVFQPCADPFYTTMKRNQYASIYNDISDFEYNNLNRPFNDLAFAPLGTQNEFEAKAKFSRDFKEGINISLDFWRLKTDVEYQNQSLNSTSFGIGMWLKNPFKNVQSFLTFQSNNFNEDYNGGVSDTTLFNSELLRFKVEIPVFLENASSRSQEYVVKLDNFIGNVSNWNVKHSISYKSGYYKYADQITNETTDTLFYQNLLIDNRGIRTFNQQKVVKNEFAFARTGNHIVDLSLGATHQYLMHNDDINNQEYQDLSLDAKLAFNISSFKVFSEAKLGLLDISGNVLLNSFANFDLGKIANLRAGFKFQSNNAYLMDRSLLGTELVLFQNEFDQTIQSTIYGKLEIPFTRTKVDFNSFLINKGIFYGESGIPFQSEELVSGLRISLNQPIRWKWFNLENSIHYHQFDNNLLNIPLLMSKHKFYVQFKMFDKNLALKIGATYSQFQLESGSIAFMPVNGVFYPTDNSTLDMYQNIDVFLVAKIQKFRLFTTLDNVLNLYDGRIIYMLEHVPTWDYKIRFGVRWILFD